MVGESAIDDGIVYHYTSPGGLLGILDSPMGRVGGVPEWLPNRERFAVLHASDVRYMNDSRELRVAGDLVAKRLTDRLDELEEGEAKVAVEAAITAMTSSDIPFGAAHRVFAVCFCSDGDLLSQWRGYAGSQGGYAIGFRRKALQFMNLAKMGDWPVTPPPARSAAGVVKVEYDNHGRLTETFTDAILGQARAQAGVAKAIPPLWGNMSRFAQYKDSAFREEQEWRLVYEAVPIEGYSVPVLFRPRQDQIVPYLPIIVGSPITYDLNPIDMNFDEVVADLVVGPGPDMLLRVDAAKSLLHRNGHDPGVVRSSEVPFKG